MTNEVGSDYLWNKRHSILYRIELSILYHQKRERFFDVWEKSAKAVAIIGGSAALANLAGSVGIKAIAALITVTSTIALVFGLSDRSKRHAELARNFRQLEAEIIQCGEREFSESDINTWESKERELETAEPPALSDLVKLCQNEIAIASGHTEMVVPIPMGRRLLAHFISFSPRNA